MLQRSRNVGPVTHRHITISAITVNITKTLLTTDGHTASQPNVTKSLDLLLLPVRWK